MSPTIAVAIDLKSMPTADVHALQERLRDGKCYTGQIDGTTNTATEEALKRCPVMDPILLIETGMHTAVITRIGVDRACTLLATGSEDKTVRLWSLPEGRLLRTLRPPIGPNNDGKVYATAVSPDGALVAAGGWDARWTSQRNMSVYLFDARTAALKARVGAFEDVIDHLTFSTDGRFLAATLASQGLRVIDVQRMTVAATDRDYGGNSLGASFAPDGRLFTVSYDGYLRSYDSRFQLVRKLQTRGGKEPFGVAAHPGGKLVAVGYSDSTKVEIYDADDLGFSFAADTRIADYDNLRTVAWSADGSRLMAAGKFATHEPDGQWRALAVIWDNAGRGKSTKQPFDMADERLSLSFFQVSRDDLQIGFAPDPDGERSVLFDLASATVQTLQGGSGRNASGLSLPEVAGPLPILRWRSAPELAGQKLKLRQNETSHSLAITPDAARFVLGTEWYLRAFDFEGPHQWERPVPGAAWAVNVTGDGRIVVVAHGDGTIRWHRMSDGQELLALFVNKDDLRWVAWTPSGYYMSSPGGEDMIGSHVNRGWEQAADFFPASRFRERFARDDVVQRVLDTLDEGKALEEANRAANIRTDTAPVTNRLPPVIKILSPQDGGVVQGTEVTVEYELRSPSGLPVDTVEVLIDGRPSRGINRVDANLSGTRTERQLVSVPARDVEVGLLARSGTLASEVATVRLKRGAGPAPSGEDLLKPRLYGVVVGVSTYQDPSLKLKYAAKDARDFAETLKEQKGGIYREVELTVLIDDKATSGAIKDALEALTFQVTSRDIGVVFLAGHDIQDSRNAYYFLAQNSDRNRLLSTAVDGLTLREQLRSLAGKALVFLDTCYAGQAMGPGARGITDINALVNELSSTENGITTYASSTGREVSQEDDSWSNGAFTKALVEGLGGPGRKGRADLTGKGVITTAQLDAWVSERVKELTRGSQHPVMIRPPTVPDFPMFVPQR